MFLVSPLGASEQTPRKLDDDRLFLKTVVNVSLLILLASRFNTKLCVVLVFLVSTTFGAGIRKHAFTVIINY